MDGGGVRQRAPHRKARLPATIYRGPRSVTPGVDEVVRHVRMCAIVVKRVGWSDGNPRIGVASFFFFFEMVAFSFLLEREIATCPLMNKQITMSTYVAIP